MNVLILMGSPRLRGNTAELCKPVIAELESLGAGVRYFTLADKNIHPCRGCYACQDVQEEYGCVQKDDMYQVVEQVLWADCVVLATPIYSWYCTAPMKAVLDRHYGLNKFYGSAQGSLWAGKYMAILATHGYDRAYATEPFETGIRRLCDHSGLTYLGMYSVQDEDNLASFQTEEAREGARLFARRLLAAMEARNQLRGLLDGEGKLTAFPAKRKKKLYALLYLAEKIQPGRDYSERELGEVLRAWHTFDDPATLRRELYDGFFLDRDPQGRVYRLAEPQPDPGKLGI